MQDTDIQNAPVGVRPSETSESAMVGGAYDGANRFDNSMLLWAPALQSADRDMLDDKPMADARSRDLLRNDSYIAGGADIHRDSIVGTMYALNAKPADIVLGRGFDDTWAEEFQQEIETKFTLYAESPDNLIDAARRETFTGLVRLSVGLGVMSGEMLASVEWMGTKGRAYGTAVNFIDTDRLSNPMNAVDSMDIRGGVKRDSFGAPVGYFIQGAHPSDWIRGADLDVWRYVPARKPWGRFNVLHIFDQLRPDQSRGVSTLVTALKEMRITKRFRDVTLQNAVLNATYAASIESELPTEAVFSQLGQDDPGKAIGKYASSYLGQIAQYAGAAKGLAIDGVKIPHLFPGTKLQLRPAGPGGPLGTEFEASLLRYVAAALGVSYEQLSRDYTQTNYSSARAAMAETHKHMQARKRVFADRFASSVYRLWLEEAVGNGLITALPRSARRPGWLYEGQNLDAISRCDWIGASRGQIDELKETQAAVLRLKYNLSTDEAECARLGLDWRVVKRQRKRERDMDTDMGISTDPAKDMENALSADPGGSNQ